MKDFTQSPKFEEHSAPREPFGPPPLPARGTHDSCGEVAKGATASLILGLLSISCLWIFGSVPAIFLGLKARRMIRESEGQLSGGGMAMVGILTGFAGIFFGALMPLMTLRISEPILHVVEEPRGGETRSGSNSGAPPTPAWTEEEVPKDQ